MKLNEIAHIDRPDHLLVVTVATIKKMLSNPSIVDTDAFLYVYRQLTENLPRIAAERALGKEWDEHPMFGIVSDECRDKWAQSYRESYLLSAAVFDVLIARSQKS